MYAKIIESSTLQASYPKLNRPIPLFSQLEWIQLFDKRCIIIGIYSADNQFVGYWYGLSGKKINWKYFINTPFTPHCGLIYKTSASNKANANTYHKKIIKLLVDFFQTQHFSLLHFALPSTIIDTQPLIWNKYLVTTKYTYHLKLEDSTTRLFDNLSSEKRKSIRRAEIDLIKILPVSNLETIAPILKQTFAKNKVKYNTNLFNAILSQFANDQNTIAYAAYNNNGDIIAATLCLYDATTCYYLFGGFNNSNKHHGAGVSCMWASILEAKKRNLLLFDFEGSMLVEVEKYFREFGGTLQPYYEVKYKSNILKIIS